MVKVRVLFFGKARELVNVSECELQLDRDSMTCKQLEGILFEKFEQLQPISQNFLLAVNQRYCQEAEQLIHLDDQSEIALFPPLSGG